MKRKINVVTLGCAKNRVDSEHLMAQLRHDRFEVVYDSDSTDAKIVVVNTCGFIGDAKQSRSTRSFPSPRPRTGEKSSACS